MSVHKLGNFSGETVKRAVAFIDQIYAEKAKRGLAFEADTGIAGDNLRKWREGVSRPSWPHMLAMIWVFGPEFLAAVFDRAPNWLATAAREEMTRKLESEIADRERRRSELTRA
jgi:hypothetical protein